MFNYKFNQTQLAYRKLFKESLWLTTKYLCGFNEQSVKEGKLTYPMYAYLHGRFLNMVQKRKWQNLFVVMPRGYFKSSMMTVGYVIWRIINNPNLRVGMATGNIELGKKFLHQQKEIVMSPLFCAVFPDIVPRYSPNSPQTDWSKTSYRVNRTATHGEPTVVVFTEHSKTEGYHFDLLICNDLVNEENFDSPTKRENTKQFVRNMSNLKDSKYTPMVIEGTFFHVDDLYQEIMKKPTFDVFKYPLYDDNMNSTFPEKFSPEYIEQQRIDNGDKFFATHYLLNPVSEERAFMSKYPFVRYREERDDRGIVVKRITIEEHLREFVAPLIGTMVANDTAGGGENLAAIIILQKDNEENVFWRYCKTKNRWTPTERLREFEVLDKEFDPYKIGVELEAQQQWDSVLPEDFLNGRSKIRAKLDDLHSGGKSKDYRIRSLEPLLYRGQFFIHESIPEKAVKDLQFYPEMKDNAVPDSLAHGTSMFTKHHIYTRDESKRACSMGFKPLYPEIFSGV